MLTQDGYGRDDSRSSSSSSHSSMHLSEVMHMYNLMDRMTGFMLRPRRTNWKAISSEWNSWFGSRPIPMIMSLPITWAYRICSLDGLLKRSGKSISAWEPSERTWAWISGVKIFALCCTPFKAPKANVLASCFAKRIEGSSESPASERERVSLRLLLRVRESVCEGVVKALLVTKRAKKRTAGRYVIGNIILQKYFWYGVIFMKLKGALDEKFVFSWLRKIVRENLHRILMDEKLREPMLDRMHSSFHRGIHRW